MSQNTFRIRNWDVRKEKDATGATFMFSENCSDNQFSTKINNIAKQREHFVISSGFVGVQQRVGEM